MGLMARYKLNWSPILKIFSANNKKNLFEQLFDVMFFVSRREALRRALERVNSFVYIFPRLRDGRTRVFYRQIPCLYFDDTSKTWLSQLCRALPAFVERERSQVFSPRHFTRSPLLSLLLCCRRPDARNGSRKPARAVTTLHHPHSHPRRKIQ